MMGALSLLMLLCAGSDGLAAEYRRVTLADDRQVVAEVVGTDENGQVLRLPQGQMTVSFSEILSMDVINATEFDAQRPWRVVVLPFAVIRPDWEEAAERLRTGVRQELGQLQRVNESGPDAFRGRLSEQEIQNLAACGINPACAAPLGRNAGATLVVMGAVGESAEGLPELTLLSVWSGAPNAQRRSTVELRSDPGLDRAPLRAATYAVLHLDLPAEPAAAPLADAAPAPAQKPTPPIDPARLRKLSYLPVPGLPSLVQGDRVGVAASLAIAVPGAVAIVAVAGHAATQPAGMIGLSLLGCYGMSVAVNQAIGLRGLQVAVHPLPEGGASLQVGTPLR